MDTQIYTLDESVLTEIINGKNDKKVDELCEYWPNIRFGQTSENGNNALLARIFKYHTSKEQRRRIFMKVRCCYFFKGKNLHFF